MKAKNYFTCIAASISLLLSSTACLQHSIDPKDPDPGISQELKDFGFATRADFKLSVNYNAPGFKTLVEVYSGNPMAENGKEKKEGVKPVFSAFTDNNGKLECSMYIPTSVKEAYLYTDRWGLPLCVKLETSERKMVYDGTKETPRTKSKGMATRAQYSYLQGDKQPYKVVGRDTDGLMALGLFDTGGYLKFDGFGSPSDYTPNYITETHTFGGDAIGDISARAQSFFDTYSGKRSELLKSSEITNIKVSKPGSVDIVVLGERAAYQNTIGYYYYEKGSAPSESSLRGMTKYLIFPVVNVGTQIKMGNTVRLKYFGKDGKGEATETFPENTVIGWFFVSDGWDNWTGQIKNWSPIERNFFFSNDTDKNMRFVAVKDAKTGIVVLGCEDQPESLFNREKEDYSDVLFFVKSDDGALDNEGKPEIPEEKPEEPSGKNSLSGLLAFEDIWPSGGDYDMNDVVVAYDRQLNFNGSNQIVGVEETFTFTQPIGSAYYDSRFAYQVSNLGTVELQEGCIVESATNSIIIDASAKTSVGKTYKVVRTFSSPLTGDVASKDFNPYIMPEGTGDNRKEVHLPNFKATSKADISLIGTGNDAYYMDKNKGYPFAIDIPKKDFVLSSEKVRIDITYPRFASWAKNFGKTDEDWYSDAPAK